MGIGQFAVLRSVSAGGRVKGIIPPVEWFRIATPNRLDPEI
ncbi:MAG: hypothetical protein QOH66_1705 [Actinomycetota bacterium]|jgi:hypothetical protein|nr:hypothetical protein [Actinomycetota bacterium]